MNKKLTLSKTINPSKANDLHLLFPRKYFQFEMNKISPNHSGILIKLDFESVFKFTSYNITCTNKNSNFSDIYSDRIIEDIEKSFENRSYIITFKTFPRLMSIYEFENVYFENIKLCDKHQIIEFECCYLSLESWN